MSVFQKLFKKKSPQADPVIQFGRYSDSYKSEPNYEAWEKSVRFFENEKYLDAFTTFFDFLNEPQKSNASCKILPGRIEFTIYQGSKIIEGRADTFKVRAEAKIAAVQEAELGWLRLLTEENYDLKFCRYALDPEGNITIIFDSYAEDCNPDKLYQALKELATTADKKDDILISEFRMLWPVNVHHTRIIHDHEKKVKYNYFRNSIRQVMEELETGSLNVSQVPGGMSYLLLDLAYRIDYLIKPEGILMECVESCHKIYFSESLTGVDQKNLFMLRKFNSVAHLSETEFYEELYEVKSTFGVTMPSSHERLTELINAQIHEMDWYYDNGHIAYAKAITGYIVGFALFAYALPEPTTALLHFYYRVMENVYFRDLGFKQDFDLGGKPHKKNIIAALKIIRSGLAENYPDIKWDTKILEFDDYALFAKSYLLMLSNINTAD